jgi:Tfp pilus assembly protein PilN
MLRTNLATRPFYNERLVHLLFGAALALVVAFTIFNAMRLVSLSTRQAALGREAARDEARAADLNARAAAVRRGIDPKALARVTNAAIEANALVDARAFSWTALFNDIEATLPADVMLTAISPTVDNGGAMRVRFVAVGRTVEGIDTFIERLEQTGRFKRVLAPSEQVTEDGLFETTIEGLYRQPVPEATAGTGGGAATGGAR